MESGKKLYLECYSGISGDMTVAALLDLGADEKVLLEALESLPVSGFRVEIKRVVKSGIDACDFRVILDKEHENHDHDMEYLHGHEDELNRMGICITVTRNMRRAVSMSTAISMRRATVIITTIPMERAAAIITTMLMERAAAIITTMLMERATAIITAMSMERVTVIITTISMKRAAIMNTVMSMNIPTTIIMSTAA